MCLKNRHLHPRLYVVQKYTIIHAQRIIRYRKNSFFSIVQGFLLKNRSLFLGLTVLRGKDKADSGKEKKITRRKGENSCRRKP